LAAASKLLPHVGSDVLTRLLAKILIVVAQTGIFTLFIGVIFFDTQLFFLQLLISVALLALFKCKHCQTSFGDGRISGRMKILDVSSNLKLIDECPVCGKPMC
jgi:hypothetical protein